MRDVNETADLLHSAAIHLLRAAGAHDRETTIGPAQQSALAVLSFRGEMPLGRLAQLEGVRSPTMTRIVTGLESSGLARRRRDEQDGRITLVAPTRRGRELIRDSRRRRIAWIASRLESLDQRDLAAVARSATALEDLFGPRDRPWRPVE